MHVCFALMVGWPLARLVKPRPLKVVWFALSVPRHVRRRRDRQPLLLRRLPRRDDRGDRPALLSSSCWPAGGPGVVVRARQGRGRGVSAARPGVLGAAVRNRLIESRLTPNAISLTGLVGNVVAAVLVTQRLFFLAGVAFILGSVMDTLDGRYSRMSGKGTPFGAFLDSTLDRIEEGIVLTAVAAYFAAQRRRPGGRGRRDRGARLADGLLHARARRGARRRVQGRDREPRRTRRDPVDRARVREGRRARRLRAARAGRLRARRAVDDHGLPAHLPRPARAVRAPRPL